MKFAALGLVYFLLLLLAQPQPADGRLCDGTDPSDASASASSAQSFLRALNCVCDNQMENGGKGKRQKTALPPVL